jgi:hypothetical protein
MLRCVDWQAVTDASEKQGLSLQNQAVQEGVLGLLDSYYSTRQNILDDFVLLTN